MPTQKVGHFRLCCGGRWVLVGESGGLVCGFSLFEGDGVAEGFELALEAAGAVLGAEALALPVWSEVAVWDVVADDVVVGDEQVVADRAERDGFAAASAQLGVVGGEVGVSGARAHSVRTSVSQRGPGRVRPERRRPADW
jgi:hypothetical protein